MRVRIKMRVRVKVSVRVRVRVRMRIRVMPLYNRFRCTVDVVAIGLQTSKHSNLAFYVKMRDVMQVVDVKCVTNLG